MRKRRCLALGIGIVLVFFLGSVSALPARAQTGAVARVVWELRLPAEFQARLYETAVVPGERVVATTPGAVIAIGGQGAVRRLIRLDTGGPRGESATLSRDGSRAGVLIRQGHAVAGFRLVALTGETLATVDAPPAFHYRLAPDGATFVGIDAGGHHLPVSAERFVYRFYDVAGRALAEVASESPQPVDSAYTPDGAAFIVNNAEGLTAFRIADGEPLWRIGSSVRFFAAAAASSQLVAASSDEQRTMIAAYRNGRRLWDFALAGNVRNLAVSPSGAFILATDGRRAHLLTPASGMPLWSVALPTAFTINSAAVNDHGVVALGAQHDDLARGIVQVLDRDRRILLERELSHGRSNGWIPTVQFDSAGRRLLVSTLEELILIAAQ